MCIKEINTMSFKVCQRGKIVLFFIETGLDQTLFIGMSFPAHPAGGSTTALEEFDNNSIRTEEEEAHYSNTF